MSIAEIVLAESTRKYDKKYSYLIPDSIADTVKPGCMVKIPFGPKGTLRDGYVLNIRSFDDYDDLDAVKFRSKLKSISSVIGHGALLTGPILQLIEWMKLRYICTYGDIIKCAVPGIAADAPEGKTVKYAELLMPEDDIIYEIENSKIRQIQHIRVLKILLEQPSVCVQELTRMAGVSPSVVKTLEKRGYISIVMREVIRDPYANKQIDRTFPPTPTDEQKDVIDTILPAIGSKLKRNTLFTELQAAGKQRYICA